MQGLCVSGSQTNTAGPATAATRVSLVNRKCDLQLLRPIYEQRSVSSLQLKRQASNYTDFLRITRDTLHDTLKKRFEHIDLHKILHL